MSIYEAIFGEDDYDSREKHYSYIYAEILHNDKIVVPAEWYLVCDKENYDGLFEITEWMKSKYSTRWLIEVNNSSREKRPIEMETSPYKYIELLARSITRELFENNKTLMFNKAGSYIELNENIRVLDNTFTNEYGFPDTDEIITIAKWLGGNHYYLRSNQNRTFDRNAFNSSHDARIEASKYVNSNQIIIKTGTVYGHEGD